MCVSVRECVRVHTGALGVVMGSFMVQMRLTGIQVDPLLEQYMFFQPKTPF